MCLLVVVWLFLIGSRVTPDLELVITRFLLLDKFLFDAEEFK